MKDDLISRTALITAFLSRQKTEHEVKNHTIPAEDVISLIQNAPTVEEKPFEINVFLENADESILFDIKKELARILTDRAEREAYAEARREAMRLDDNEDTYKWRGHA